jgi:hypothetical protein
MEIIFPQKVRAAIYVLVTLGTAIIVPLHAGGVINDLFFNVWTSVTGATTALAALNTINTSK